MNSRLSLAARKFAVEKSRMCKNRTDVQKRKDEEIKKAVAVEKLIERNSQS